VSRFGPGILSLVFAVVIFEMPKAGEVILIELLGAIRISPLQKLPFRKLL